MTPLMYAVKDNRTGLLDRMIELGADVGARNNASIPRNTSVYRGFQRATHDTVDSRNFSRWFFEKPTTRFRAKYEPL